MSAHHEVRPAADELAPYYATYLAKVPDGDVLETLARGPATTSAVLEPFVGDRETWRYAAGKWSVREVLGHVIDTERLFTYRALTFARKDPGPLPGMDQDLWATASNAHHRPLGDLLDELRAVRDATTALFRSLPSEAWAQRGVASDCSFTVRALAWIVAGHEIHHRRIVEERYR